MHRPLVAKIGRTLVACESSPHFRREACHKAVRASLSPHLLDSGEQHDPRLGIPIDSLAALLQRQQIAFITLPLGHGRRSGVHSRSPTTS